MDEESASAVKRLERLREYQREYQKRYRADPRNRERCLACQRRSAAKRRAREKGENPDTV